MVKLNSTEEKNLIAGILLDFIENDRQNLLKYLKHCQFDILAIQGANELIDAWLGHYRIKAGEYDVARATNDLLRWPPIWNEICRLRHENGSLTK